MIVGSILLAFGIEAWWDGSQDRAVEKAHLVALESDLTESIRLIGETDTPVSITTPEASEWAPIANARWRNRLLTKLTALQNTSARRSELHDELLLLQALVGKRLTQLN